jgi:hypothetical protein
MPRHAGKCTDAEKIVEAFWEMLKHFKSSQSLPFFQQTSKCFHRLRDENPPQIATSP